MLVGRPAKCVRHAGHVELCLAGCAVLFDRHVLAVRCWFGLSHSVTKESGLRLLDRVLIKSRKL